MNQNKRHSQSVSPDAPARSQVSTRVAALTPAQQSLHNNFLASVIALKKDIVRTVYYLAMINRQKIHRMLGFDTISDYAMTTAGFTPKQTRNFLNLAKHLPRYQDVERAIEDGAITWAKAREICRATDPADQKQWIDVAARVPLKELQARLNAPNAPNTPPQPMQPPRSASSSLPAPTPASPSAPTTVPPLAPRPTLTPADDAQVLQAVPQWHYVSLKLSSEQLARWSALMEQLQKGCAESKEDILLNALHGMLSGKDATVGATVPYLIVLLHCPTCGRTTIPTNRGEAEAEPALLQAGSCDAMVEDRTGARRSVIAPRTRRLALRNARYRCQASGCMNTSFLEIHHRIPLAQGGSDRPENLVVLCWRCHRRLHQADDAAREALRNSPP